MVDYPHAIPMFVNENRVFINQNSHYAMVIHGTACGSQCTAQDVAVFFQNDPQEASTHYIVGKDGTVVQCVLEKDGAGGNCCVEQGYDPFWQPFVQQGTNLNVVTLSIEHCHWTTDNSDALTPVQETASFQLVAYLVKKYNIPLSNIKGHNTIDPINRANCPGNYPWAQLMSYLQQGGPMVPQGWSDNGTTLTAPNGFIVVQGFRDWVLNNNWDPGNWPLENEQGLNPLENSNPALGAGTQQVFRWATLEWTQSRGVFVAWVGVEFLWYRQQLAAAQAEIQQLQKQINLNIPQIVGELNTVIQQLEGH